MRLDSLQDTDFDVQLLIFFHKNVLKLSSPCLRTICKRGVTLTLLNSTRYTRKKMRMQMGYRHKLCTQVSSVLSLSPRLLALPSPSSPPSILRPILHAPTPHIPLPTRRSRPTIPHLLPAPNLPLILHRNTATATTSAHAIIATAPLHLIQPPYPRPLHHRHQPPHPDSARQRAGPALRIRRLVREHVRCIGLARFLRQPVRGAPCEDAGTE